MLKPHHFFTERGKFLALDLGGTNFRVLIINLGENHFDMQSKIYAIPNHIMTGTGLALFDHIAECLANFMKVGTCASVFDVVTIVVCVFTFVKLKRFLSLAGAQCLRGTIGPGFHIQFPSEAAGANKRHSAAMDKGILVQWSRRRGCRPGT